MQRVLLVVVALLALLVDGFFALVNFYPVAPPRSRGPRLYVLAEMDETQAEWFQKNVLDEFNDAHDSNVVVRRVEQEHLLEAVRDARAHANDVLLAVLPSAITEDAIRRGLVAPIDGAVSPARIASDFSELRPEILRAARARNRQYFLPRMSVLDVAVYRTSMVRDALLHWQVLRPQIDAALRAANGHGLPAGFQLEQSPFGWDSYDAFVLAYYWAHRSYGGHPARPRVAHRTGDTPDGQIDVVAGLYRAGGTDATLAHPDAQPALDYFGWESLYRAEGLYANGMYDADGLDDEGTLAALRHGELFMASVDQMEAFSIHGAAHRDAPAQVADEDDLAFMPMPHFASLDLDAQGHPVRTAGTFSFREDAVWALPNGAPDPRLAYRLLKWVFTKENHVRECEALGMLPLRADVIRDAASIYRVDWMGDVFAAGFAQWPRAQPLPTAVDTAGLGSLYARLWDRAIAQRAASVSDRAALATLLRTPPPATRAAADDDNAAGGTAPDTEGGDSVGDEDSASFFVPSLRDRLVLEGLHGGDAGAAGDDGGADAGAEAGR